MLDKNLPLLDKLGEECGVIGIFNTKGDPVAYDLHSGLFALQHRGQESAGIVTNDDGKLYQHKDSGLVSEVFNSADSIEKLKGNIGLGHVRYAGSSEFRDNAQPLVSRYCKGSITLAHNGNIINANTLKSELEKNGAIFQTTTGVEVLMHLLAIARTKMPSIEQAVLSVMEQIEGAYSMVLMSPRKILAIRDPQGFRPLCIGKTKDSYIVASESSALTALKAEFVRDVAPGEVVVIDINGIKSFDKHCGQKPSLCSFEYIYFARPDSKIDGVNVYNTRLNIGKALAKSNKVKSDLVIGVPDSGLHFAQGYSLESKIPYGDGFVRNRYTGRAFIKQTQHAREKAVHLKLSVLEDNIKGKSVIVVDDSIVRGTTTANLVKLLKQAGAKQVHIRIGCPPFLWPCHFGTDIPSRKELLAVKYNKEEMCKKLGADSLAFLPLEEFDNIGLRKDFGYCSGCFSGKYPVKI